MSLTRRSFITSGMLTALGGAAWWLHGGGLHGGPRTGTLLSAFEDARGDQYVGGLELDHGRVFGARVPVRAHGCAIDPLDPRRVLFFARRPGTQAFTLHRDTMQVHPAFHSGAGRHLSGHGVFSPAGDLLFVPEYDYENVRGIVSVRDARDFRILREIDTQGIDPHELTWLPDGRTLLVANGGILTHPKSFRRKLNLPAMDSSLCAFDAASGDCLEQWRLPDHLLSIRHLAMASDGTVAAGLQYQGDSGATPGIVALHRPSTGLRLLRAPQEEMKKFKGYVASIAVSERHDLIAAACPVGGARITGRPIGGGIACWSLRQGRYLGFIVADEPYGLSRLHDGSILASQRDGSAFGVDETRLQPQRRRFAGAAPVRWDDHWTSA